MHPSLVAALLACAFLAGCAGDGDGETCPPEGGTGCPTTTGERTTTICETVSQGRIVPCGGNVVTDPPAPPAANVPPAIRLAVSDANGTATDTIMAGGTLVFDATGSTDGGDGDGLSAIAIVAQDTNGTPYEPQALYLDGTFRTVRYTFAKAGLVNVTVSGIDRRGDVTTIQREVYVNGRVLVGETYLFTGALPAEAAEASSCAGPTSGQQVAVDGLAWSAGAFEVQNGTTHVVATILEGAGEIALCDPMGAAISGESTTTVTSEPGTAFARATAAQGYYVSVYSGAPNQHVVVEVVVHYDPQA